MTQYIKWSNEEGDVVGILEMVSHNKITIKTNVGVITIPKDDGVVTDISEEEYNNLSSISTDKEEPVEEFVMEGKKGDKMLKCVEIYDRMISTHKRCEIIREFSRVTGIGERHGSTNFETIKKRKLNK